MNPEIIKIAGGLLLVPLYLFVMFGGIAVIAYRILIPIFTFLNKQQEEHDKLVQNPFWPDLHSKEVAMLVAKSSSEIVFLLSAVTIILGVNNYDEGGVLSIAIGASLTVIGFFIRKMSRVAAILALLIYLGSKILVFSSLPLVGSIVIFIVVVNSLINGVRATVKYHRIHN